MILDFKSLSSAWPYVPIHQVGIQNEVTVRLLFKINDMLPLAEYRSFLPSTKSFVS